jgi:nucleotide-binding universal stress UspA family protein
LYVIPLYPKNLFDVIIPYQTHFKKEAKKFMAKARKLAAQRGILFKPMIIYGSPSAEILDLAKPKKYQLIVIGSRGQSMLKEAFMGSVANVVVHRSKIPVIVVK